MPSFFVPMFDGNPDDAEKEYTHERDGHQECDSQTDEKGVPGADILSEQKTCTGKDEINEKECPQNLFQVLEQRMSRSSHGAECPRF